MAGAGFTGSGLAVGGDSFHLHAVTDPGAVSDAESGGSVRRCPDAREGIRFYRSRYADHRAIRGIETPWPVGRKPRHCADADYLAEIWPVRSFQARLVTERWLEEHMLKDFAYDGQQDPWPLAVREVQVVFPGTEDWQLSCSDAEGWGEGLKRWLGYAGAPYSDHLRDSDTVGGPMQFRFSTFTGMWRRAVEYALEHGYRVPRRLLGDSLVAKTRAWRSPLGQAMAAGWARYTGNDNSHWAASWGRGC